MKVLEPGDHVTTEFSDRKTVHSIVCVKPTPDTLSGYSYRVMPAIRGTLGDDFIDSRWFTYATGFDPHRDLDREDDEEDSEE